MEAESSERFNDAVVLICLPIKAPSLEVNFIQLIVRILVLGYHDVAHEENVHKVFIEVFNVLFAFPTTFFILSKHVYILVHKDKVLSIMDESIDFSFYVKTRF